MSGDKNKGRSQIVQIPDRCLAEGCEKGQQKLSFCSEHFAWYKEGLINKKGERPADFDKKYQLFLRKRAA